MGRTNMLSWGFATEGVCVRGGPHVAKADNVYEFTGFTRTTWRDRKWLFNFFWGVPKLCVSVESSRVVAVRAGYKLKGAIGAGPRHEGRVFVKSSQSFLLCDASKKKSTQHDSKHDSLSLSVSLSLSLSSLNFSISSSVPPNI